MLKRKKVLSITLEAIALAILSIGFYVFVVMLLLRPPEWLVGNTLYFLTGNGFSSIVPVIVLLIFDVIWVAIAKFMPLKNVHIRIVLTLLIFVFTAAFLSSYMMAYMLKDFHW